MVKVKFKYFPINIYSKHMGDLDFIILVIPVIHGFSKTVAFSFKLKI